MNLSKSNSHKSLPVPAETTMSTNGKATVDDGKQDQQQESLSAVPGQPHLQPIIGDFAAVVPTAGLKLSDDNIDQQQPEKKRKIANTDEQHEGSFMEGVALLSNSSGGDVPFDPFSQIDDHIIQKPAPPPQSPLPGCGGSQQWTNIPTRFSNIMSSTSTQAAAGAMQPALSGFQHLGGPASSFQQLLMQNQALISAAAVKQQSSMQSNHPTSNIAQSRAAAASPSVGPGTISQHQQHPQQVQQQQGNPSFFPMGNQQLLQSQLAAYQAGLMGLPPQFLQQQAPSLMVPSVVLPPHIAAFSSRGFGSIASMQGSGLQGAITAAGMANAAHHQHPLSMEDAAKLSGRKPHTLYMPCDHDNLSEYQCLVRKQIEIFEARPEDVESNAKGRNKPIVLGQVGIRCRHCHELSPKNRQRGATYYPAKLNGLYQAAQSMASGHLCYHCEHIPRDIRQELLILRERKSSAGGGKKYWGDGVRILGVEEDENGLRFSREKT
jgi:hypothetical protein